MVTNSTGNKLSILCLHGKRQTATIFRDKILKWVLKIEDIATCDFLDAPFELPLEHQGDAVAMRTWGSRVSSSPTVSYTTAVELISAQQQLHAYDVFLGFSEGCIAIANFFRFVANETLWPRAAIFVGSPNPSRFDVSFDGRVSVPSWHVIGERDEIVLPSESRDFASFSCQEEGRVVTLGHHAHSVPQSSEFCNLLVEFVAPLYDAKVKEARVSLELTEEVQDELDMLLMVFGEDNVTIKRECEVRRGAGPRTLISVRLHDGAVAANSTVHFTISMSYPAEAPQISLTDLPSRITSRKMWLSKIVAETRNEAHESCGSPMLMNLVLLLRDRIETALTTNVFQGDEDGSHNNSNHQDGADSDAGRRNWWEDEDESLEVREAAVRQATLVAKQRLSSAEGGDSSQWRSRSGGGSWRITIGLIGKPSAGKSTLYNAVTHSEQKDGESAKVAAFPFTTIDPNIGEGRCPLRCPCGNSGAPAGCGAMYSHVVVDGEVCRRHPVLIKDVAGLVKGAHRGHGKGNRFLNDLCDADVLIHVVDGAAATDADGCACPAGEGSAVDDVTWVRDEVHSWIFDNVLAKWGVIVKRPEKLVGMFSGYRATQALVEAVLQRCGVSSPKDLAFLVPLWTRQSLHELVAVFVAMRFPLLVALNKSDLPSSTDIFHQLQTAYPHETFIRISAKAEWDLMRLKCSGAVHYNEGDKELQCNATHMDGTVVSEKEKATVEEHRVGVLAMLGSTGVQRLLRRAVECCHPLSVFPVQEPLTPLVGVSDAACSLQMPHCLLMKPGSNVDDVFHAFCFSRSVNAYADPGAVKLVRFELVELLQVGAERKVKILRKDDSIPLVSSVVRILTNSKK